MVELVRYSIVDMGKVGMVVVMFSMASIGLIIGGKHIIQLYMCVCLFLHRNVFVSLVVPWFVNTTHHHVNPIPLMCSRGCFVFIWNLG